MSEGAAVERLTQRLTTWLAHPRGHFLTIGLALLLTLPCLSDRLVLDDHVLAVQARAQTGLQGLHSRPLDLFRFTDGSVENNHRLMDEGVLLPWWSHPHLRVAFFRPLSSLTHVFDFTVFDGHGAWMGLHTLVWWAALLFSLAHIYHRFYGHTAFAGACLLLYAIDDVHGATLGWLSNRNAVIATLLAMPALGALHRARTQGWRAGYVIGPVCFALGLCAGETALGLCAYLFAYAVFVDRGALRARVAMLAPYLAIVIVWRVAYQAFGYGAFGSDGYHDPGREPLAFIAAAAVHVPILLAAQFGAGFPPLADLLAWGPPDMAPVLVATALVTLLVCVALMWPVLRRDALNRFWLSGALIAVLPSAASVPGERLLMFVGIGASPVIVATLQYWIARFVEHRRVWLGVLSAGLLLTHVVAAPIGLVLRCGSLNAVGSVIDHADASLGFDRALADADVTIINPPFDVMASYVQVARTARRQVHPRHLRWLAPASSELSITRTAEHTLRIAPAHGFVRSVTERHYNSAPEQLGVGHRVQLTGLRIDVIEVGADGRPSVVDFTFDAPLDGSSAPDAALGSTRLRLLQWNGRAFERFVPPAIGATLKLPADGFFPTLARNVLTMTP